MNEELKQLIERLRNGTDMPARDDGAFRWYSEITDEAADALESMQRQVAESRKDAELGMKLRALVNGGALDLTDSPKSFVSTCIRLVQELDAAAAIGKQRKE